jgi:hypothetical protein
MKKEFKIVEAEIFEADKKDNYLLVEVDEKQIVITSINVDVEYKLIEDYIHIDGRYFDDHTEEVHVKMDAREFYGECETWDGDGLYFVDTDLANQIAEQLELELCSQEYNLYWRAVEHFNN